MGEFTGPWIVNKTKINGLVKVGYFKWLWNKPLAKLVVLISNNNKNVTKHLKTKFTMKKKLMIMAVAIASMVGMNAVAQTADSKSDKKCEGKGQCDKKGPKCDKQKGQCPNPFEGITLTADQQTKLDALKADQKAKREEMKAQKQQKDSLARVDRKQAKRDYLKQVQGILTPDQYVMFLENIVVEQPAGQPQGGPRGDRNGVPGKCPKSQKGPKCDKAPKQAQVAE